MSEEYKFICKKCNYKTNLKHLIIQHKKTILHKTGKRGEHPKKEEKKIYKCDKCIYESLNNNNYLTHLLNNHGTKKMREKKFKFYCKICDFGVFTKSS
jgi:hypothetical protein